MYCIKQKVLFFQQNSVSHRQPNPTAFTPGKLPTELEIPDAQEKSRTIISSKWHWKAFAGSMNPTISGIPTNHIGFPARCVRKLQLKPAKNVLNY